MSDTRYRWNPYADESPEAYEHRIISELKQRDHVRKLGVDSHLKCAVRSCRRQCRQGERCFYPNKNVNTIDNKLLAHVQCVDEFCAKAASNMRAEAKAAKSKRLEQKGLIKVPGQADVKAWLTQLIKEAESRGYNRGLAAGKQAILTDLMGELTDFDGEGPYRS